MSASSRQNLGRDLQRFAVMDAAVDNFKTQTLVDAMRKVIVDPGVGGHFGATLRARPVFGSVEQFFAKATTAVVFDEIPAFDVADRMAHIAAVGVGTERDFEKSNQGGIGGFGHKDYGGKGTEGRSGEGGGEFFGVMFGGIFGPQGVEQAREGLAVGGTSRADRGFGHDEHFSRYRGARTGSGGEARTHRGNLLLRYSFWVFGSNIAALPVWRSRRDPGEDSTFLKNERMGHP